MKPDEVFVRSQGSSAGREHPEAAFARSGHGWYGVDYASFALNDYSDDPEKKPRGLNRPRPLSEAAVSGSGFLE